MAANGNDEPGVMGNLPRSRPGQRSAKRAGGAGARAKKPATARPAGSQRKTTTRAAAKKPTARRATPRPQAPRPARTSGGDPLTQAVQLAGKVAAVGVRTAADIVKRLPRP